MVRALTLLTLATVGCIQPPPYQPYPVDIPEDTPPARGEPLDTGRPYEPPPYQPSQSGDPSSGASRPAGGDGYGPSEPHQAQGARNPYGGAPFVTQFGLVFGNDSAWVDTRTQVGSGTIVDAGVYFSEEDVVFDIGFVRMGQAREGSPLTLGAGIGFQAGSLEDPLDFVSALVLTGIAAYHFDSSYRTRILGKASFSPDVTTFGDADSMIDARVGLELDLGDFASVGVGYRYYEWGVDDAEDRKLEDNAYVGVRLAF